MYFYKYQVTFYDEDSKKRIKETGITGAESYIEAVRHLCLFYGEDDIEDFFIELVLREGEVEERVCRIDAIVDKRREK